MLKLSYYVSKMKNYVYYFSFLFHFLHYFIPYSNSFYVSVTIYNLNCLLPTKNKFPII